MISEISHKEFRFNIFGHSNHKKIYFERLILKKCATFEEMSTLFPRALARLLKKMRQEIKREIAALLYADNKKRLSNFHKSAHPVLMTGMFKLY